ncbi:nuclear transcription factor Y subunit C-4-like [Phragmites australis]|uniref:nuclear transcription factor Y subunit C-4-like n=1 Tax=Phragmites australis TaxID=29695 RepID=UPI002D769437|nr:nuclear transcription factor Y subunit C-4-like [Phragmites australis]XP_062223970.1 nuclear transcription factor Y subunit C-4-like [Phragmites australis]
MEPSSQPQPVIGITAGGPQGYPAAAAAAAYPPPAMVPGAPAVVPLGSQPTAPFPAELSAQHQLVYQQAQQFHQQLQQQQQKQLREFWTTQMDEIEQTTDFKNHSLPLARIKKIMKADEDVRMISSEAPVVFAKACEIFILELTLRSWMHTEENKRRTLQKNDIAAAITRTDIYDFLVDIIPRDEMKEEGLGLPRVGLPPAMGAPADCYPPYYYVPAQQVPGAGMMYGGQQGRPVTYVWQQPQGQEEEPPEEQQQS